MRTMSVILFAILAFSAFAGAAEIKTMFVKYPSGSDTVSAYLAMPAGGGKHPSLIVIHEWWGLTDWIKENARDFARMGYVALAIDLYHGGLTNDPQEASRLMMSVPKERATADLRAAFEYLANLKEVNPSKIGVIGWCMGGSYTFIAAVNLPKLAACVIDYGKVDTSRSAIEGITCPVLCNFAALDKGYTPEMGKEFEAAMKSDGKQIEFHIYPGVNHAFMNPNNAAGFNEAQTKIAWKNIYVFLDRYLKH